MHSPCRSQTAGPSADACSAVRKTRRKTSIADCAPPADGYGAADAPGGRPIPGRPRARSHHVIGRVPSGSNVSYGGAGSDVAASADSTVDASQGLYGDMRLHGCPSVPVEERRIATGACAPQWGNEGSGALRDD